VQGVDRTAAANLVFTDVVESISSNLMHFYIAAPIVNYKSHYHIWSKQTYISDLNTNGYFVSGFHFTNTDKDFLLKIYIHVSYSQTAW
jgi:hypothetical protein